MADTVMLTEHEAIRDWAAARMGFPAIIDVSPAGGMQPMVRLVFDQHAYQDQDRAERPANAGGYDLVEWDEWFKVFDEQQAGAGRAQGRSRAARQFPRDRPTPG